VAVVTGARRRRRAKRRLAVPAQFVLETFFKDPARELSCRDLAGETGLGLGALRPVLARLEAVGWVTSRWEATAADAVRPSRRRYRLAPDGVAPARQALAEAGSPLPLVTWGFRTGGGA
jgi:PadR family transcriptional regulator PadR